MAASRSIDVSGTKNDVTRRIEIYVTDSDICNVRRIIRFLTHVDKERFYSGRVRKSFRDYDDAKCDPWFLLDMIRRNVNTYANLNFYDYN